MNLAYIVFRHSSKGGNGKVSGGGMPSDRKFRRQERDGFKFFGFGFLDLVFGSDISDQVYQIRF